jgi:PIN domain nuclease of toxin-antitoxin system
MVALLWREPGWEVVAKHQERVASTVNIAEVGSVLSKAGHTIDEVVFAVASLDLTAVVNFDEAQAVETARLRPLTAPFGLGLGDRACLALANIRSLPILTADQVWQEAAPHLSIKLIR